MGCKDIGMMKSEFAARSHFISAINSDIASKFRVCTTLIKTTNPYMVRQKSVVYFRTEYKSFQLFRTDPKLSYPSREAQNILSICTLHTLKLQKANQVKMECVYIIRALFLKRK